MTEEKLEYITVEDLPKETFVHPDGSLSIIYKGSGGDKCQDATIAPMQHFIQVNMPNIDITPDLAEDIRKLKDD